MRRACHVRGAGEIKDSGTNGRRSARCSARSRSSLGVMAHIVIAYATVEGHTTHIAEEMRDSLGAAGHTVEVLHVHDRDTELPGDADAVIVGGPIHAGASAS